MAAENPSDKFYPSCKVRCSSRYGLFYICAVNMTSATATAANKSNHHAASLAAAKVDAREAAKFNFACSAKCQVDNAISVKCGVRHLP